MQKKLPEKKDGSVSILPMQSIPALWKFSTGQFALLMIKAQKTPRPEAVIIHKGVYDAQSLHAAINDPSILAETRDGYLLKRPLYIDHDAAFILRGTQKTPLHLKLSVEDGAFIVNGGSIFAFDARLSGWSTENADYSRFKKDKQYRPFYTAWNGSNTWFARSSFQSLGFAEAKAYGISLSSDSRISRQHPHWPRPAGWIVNCRFEDLYYGLYSYEADDIAIVRNVYANNIIYGIDPHDRSRRLIIAQNEAFGTKHKHGIIVSRDVSDSWIFSNNSHHNRGSGIMIDRSSRNNVVARNIAVYNEGYGIAILESENTLIYKNWIIKNKKEGLKIRNSWDITAVDNIIIKNEGGGVRIGTKDLSSDKRRDFQRDPYQRRASLDLAGGEIGFNAKSDIAFENIDQLGISNVFLRGGNDKSLQGNIRLSEKNLLVKKINKKQSFKIIKISKK